MRRPFYIRQSTAMSTTSLNFPTNHYYYYYSFCKLKVRKMLKQLNLLLLAIVALSMIETVNGIRYTSWPVQPIYNVKRDIRKDETTLVFVYSCMCPRSQRTIPEFTKAAKELKQYYGIKAKSLEYYQTGFEFVKVVPNINRFPVLMLYRADGSKLRYGGIDPPYASADDFIRFTLDNEYAYDGENDKSATSNSIW